MATAAPDGLDVTNLKFKLQNKVPVFRGDGNVANSCNLLAAASVHGLVFAGTNGPQLRVIQLKDLTGQRIIDDVVPLRTVPLPSEPYQMAVSCDHALLAVDVLINGVSFIQIYSVPSFLSSSVIKLHEIRTSPDECVRSTQLLWNPVLHNMFAVCCNNGCLSVYTLKEPTGIEFHSLDKNEGAMCGCWSPKGKQLVVGFANGKLVQYKPDLKPARTIVCPQGVMDSTFNVIALQWLSTYQFAAVFLSHAEESVPALFVVNAPKVGNPTFINYDDICYSQSGPRKGQVFLYHIIQWNLLLMASANSMELGILGTTETGETPTWYQWTTTDEARAELPLSQDKQETFPIGFAFETGCTHQVLLGEQNLPTMPMIHMLSTYGYLVSFNVLNLTPGVPNLCSPPKPTIDNSGKFEKVDFQNQQTSKAASAPTMISAPVQQQSADISFAIPAGATSTPAINKTKSFFSPSENKSPMNLFGTASTNANPIAPTFGKQITFGGIPTTNAQPVTTEKPLFATNNSPASFGQVNPPAQNQSSLLKASLTQPQKSIEFNKPLINVPPTYTPPAPQTANPVQPSGASQYQKTNQKKVETVDDTNSVIWSLVSEEVRKFERELLELQKSCKSLNTDVGTKDESASIIRNLKELQDLSVQATESTESLTSDVQALRLGLNEAFAMVAEANSKNVIFQHPSPHQFQETHAMSHSSRRQLASLQNMLAVNENQLQIVNKQIDAQWSAIQDAIRLNSKRRMHVPSLEVLYQTLSKQQEILNRQREKVSYIKHKLGMRESIRGLEKSRKQNVEEESAVIDSLTDSIISMSIADKVLENTQRMSGTKMASLRDILNNRKIVIIKPGRPDRIGLNSEVVRERRNAVRKMKTEKEKEPPKIVTEKIPVKPMLVRKVEEKPTPKLDSKTPVEKAKTFELPKATTLPSFGGIKPQPTVVAAPIAISAANQQNQVPPVAATAAAVSTSTAFNFGPPITTKASPFAATIISASTTTTVSAAPAMGSIFSFGQPTVKPLNQTTKPTENTFQKEINLFGSTTIKPIPAVPTATKDKENQDPVSKSSTSVFGFGGNTIIQPVVKEPPKPVVTELPKPALPSFGNSSNSAFSFGAATSTPLTFGSSSASQPQSLLSKEIKEKASAESKKEENPIVETKEVKPAPPSYQAPKEIDKGKAEFPVISNLLEKPVAVPAISGTTQKQGLFGSVLTPTVGTTTNAFGSFKSGTTPASSATTTSSFSSLLSGTGFAGFGISTTASTTTTSSSSSTAETSSTITPITNAATGFSFGSFSATATATDLSVKTKVDQPDPKTQSETPATTVSLGTISSTKTTTAAPNFTIVTNAPTTVSPTEPSTISSFAFGSSTLPATTKSSASDSSSSAPVSSTVEVTAPSTTADSTSNMFGAFNICSPSTPAPMKSSGNIFGSTSFSTPKTDSALIFGGTSSNTGSAFGTPESSKPTSIFGSTVTTTTSTTGTGFFGSVTNNAGTGNTTFGSSTGANPLFGGAATPSSGGNLFGSVSPATTNTTTPSIFGTSTGSLFGSTSVTTAASIFGGTTTTSATSGSGLFGAAAATTTPAAGGSIFGGASATFGSGTTNSGNIFGTAQPSTGFGSSAFGQPTSPQPTTQASIFGGGTSASGFGSSGFGSSASGAGAFSQSIGAGVAQTGFGSPTSPQQSAFNKPVFGAAATFGGAPAFGGSPGFGASATFGSPPAFGASSGFGQAALSPSNQSNSLFEQLGSTGGGLSFGNIAQQQNQKPSQFEGSSFSSWR
ncbi:nuclear pore complex protein Nup214 [Uranotaenia lowii]|uniref:nuclear pore complex protein Nup214 n=1 Tax=Uranotaenia lowii TaxID=190385 RepID=UPI00247882F0|nr:nuclear pore complex protein Nup214 [Uranotaenia lowii]XP_055591086.1 nuclear pore complex protein Nup214 [Uranotaenia lowii]